MKTVMVDDGNGVEIMYLDLYKGLKLRLKDFTPYSSLLMSFDEKIVIPRDEIRLPVQTGLEVVEVYSSYTTIVAKPWLHTLGAVVSTLHQKVKFPFKGWVLEI